MTELYSVFLIVGLTLFALIVAYSIFQKKRKTQYNPLKNKAEPVLGNSRIKPSVKGSAIGNIAIDSDITNKLEEAHNLLNSDTRQDTQTKTADSHRVQQEQAPTLGSVPKTNNVQADPPAEDVVTQKAQNEPSIQSVSHYTETKLTTEQTIESADSETVSIKDLATELVVKMINETPIEQSTLLAVFREYDYKFVRKVNIYGLNEMTDEWRDIEYEQPSARFTSLGLSIQLVDQKGTVSKKEIHDFQQMVLSLVDKADATFKFSMDLDEALIHANRLDEITRRYDSMVVLHVVSRSPTGFRVADVESCSRDLMLSPDSNGVYRKLKGHKKNQAVLYKLGCADNENSVGIKSENSLVINILMLYMSVPANESPGVIFQGMMKDAVNLATWLDGKVTDQQGKLMTQSLNLSLTKQINNLVVSMQQEGITPGDVLSRKIF